mgnify:CR=1 FL=1
MLNTVFAIARSMLAIVIVTEVGVNMRQRVNRSHIGSRSVCVDLTCEIHAVLYMKRPSKNEPSGSGVKKHAFGERSAPERLSLIHI